MRDIEDLKTTYTRLTNAILNGDKNAVKLIREAVEAGFPVNYIDKDGWTLLHQAAGHNRPECCRALIELGADPNLKDNCGWTPFLNACWRVNIDCAKLLIDAGADWNIPDGYGRLPLKDLGLRGWTVEKAELEAYIARHLNLQKLDEGTNRLDAVPRAKKVRNMKNKKELKETYDKLHSAILQGGEPHERNDNETAQLIQEAVAAGFPIDYQNIYGWTLLHYAVDNDKPECCRMLIELGADVNLRDKWGATPFYDACNYGKIEYAKRLIDAGARWDIPDNNGNLPIDVLRTNEDREELTEYIKERYSQVRHASEQEEPSYQQEL